jgi:hypothetical protein
VILEAILQASRDYDIDGLDKAIIELEKYRYDVQGDLVEWLREQSGKSAFEQIEARLNQEP